MARSRDGVGEGHVHAPEHDDGWQKFTGVNRDGMRMYRFARG